MVLQRVVKLGRDTAHMHLRPGEMGRWRIILIRICMEYVRLWPPRLRLPAAEKKGL